jgi:predicted Zn-dependent peptidase
MIHYNKFTLKNGLKVIVHEDFTTPMVAMNILYDVGAKDENPNQTGFAHLFEHLMFGGSVNIPEYDEPLQNAGGENNAYTTNDLTNYYIQIPAKNAEIAFWLESDRMLSLAFGEKSLDVQRKVVCEEFKEHYINKPYGDAWKFLRELVYTQHPYQWMTIGKELSHIENAQLQDVKNFFFKHYRPQNAILCVAGNITTEKVKELSEKWFEPIEAGEKYNRNIADEPEQTSPRKLVLEKEVPVSVIYKAYPMAARREKNYYIADLISDVLSGGNSARLHQRLVKEQKLFSQIDCYHTGSVEKGLLVIEGKISEGITAEQADAAIEKELDLLKSEKIAETELEKVKTKIESMLAFEDLSLLNRANNLAFYELLGDASQMNTEFENYNQVTVDDIFEQANEILNPNKCSTMFYLAKKAN